MDPNTQGTEAERWLGIAAKLLTARDFLGSKTFAIRARESDPNNVISDQILAVVDTLIAAEKKINDHYDWYAILQLAQMARDPEVIATQYRRLVFLLNPDRNGLPFADYAFRLVVDAWSVLSDPTKKWLYDSELSLYLQQLDSHQQRRVDPVRLEPAQLNTLQFFQQPQQQSQAPAPPPPAPAPAPHPERVAQPLQPQWQHRQQKQLEERDQEQQSIQFRGPQQPQPQPNAWLRLRQEHQRQQRQQPPEQRHQQQQQPSFQPQQQKEQEPREFLPPQQRVPTQPQPNSHPQRLQQREQQPLEQQLLRNERQRNEKDGGGNERPTATIASVGSGSGSANDNIEMTSFWTACPYCFYIYEYPETYMDYTLRCQNCRRAFHAARIPNPPPISNGSDSGAESFCSWGFFPLGFSMTRWKNSNQMGNKNGFLNWVPFSPMFACPVNGNGNVAGYYFNAAEGRKTVGRKARGRSPGPRVYYDDDDTFDGVSESSNDADSSDDWGSTRRKKKKKNGKRRGRPKKANVLKDKKGNQNVVAEGGDDGGENSQGRIETQEVASPVSAVGAKADANKKAGGSNSRKQTGKVVKDRGKLDLNVEFSNEVEEHAPTMSAGNGEEEAIEGIGFFEGLDEFLSSLPILNVVGDEKAKPS